MKKSARILISVLLIVVMFLFASCAELTMYIRMDPIDSKYEVNSVMDGQAAPAAATPAATPAATQAQTPAAETPTAAPAAEAAPAATPAAESGGSLSTKEEIVGYYVSCYNKIASEGKSAARVYDYTSQYKNILELGGNSTLKTLAEKLMGNFMKENTERIDSAVADVPPAGVTSSALTAADISDATCTDNGDTYTVVLKSNGTDSSPEEDPTADTGAGKFGPLMKTTDITDAVGSAVKFEGLHIRYSTCVATATIDKATGHITHIEYQMPCVLHFDKVTAAVVVTVENCDIGLLTTQRWEIGY